MPLTQSVENVHAAQEARRSREAAEGLCVHHKDRSRGPCSPPAFPTALQPCQHEMCLTLCCGTHLLVGHPPAPLGPSLPTHGTGEGTCKGGGGKAMLTQQRGFLTFFKDLPSFRLIQELLLPPKILLVTAQSPTSNLQLSAFTALPWQKSSATCNSVQNLKKKRIKKTQRYFSGMGRQLGKVSLGNGKRL